MKRDLYYIPEEEMDEIVYEQRVRKSLAVIQMIVGFLFTLSFVCTDAGACTEIPYGVLVLGLIFGINGTRMMCKFNEINEKYDLKIW